MAVYTQTSLTELAPLLRKLELKPVALKPIQGGMDNSNFFLHTADSEYVLTLFESLSFEDVGFFDENFFLYFEDIDLCKRLKNKGKKIFLVSNLQIKHLGAQSSSDQINWERELTRNWHWMWSTFSYHNKHKGFFVSLFIVFPKLFSSIFKILVYSFLFNDKKKQIYFMRFSGLVNAIKGKKSWYRPKI